MRSGEFTMKNGLTGALIAAGLLPVIVFALPFLGIVSIQSNSPPWSSTPWTFPVVLAWLLSLSMTPAILYAVISDRLDGARVTLFGLIELTLYLGWFVLLVVFDSSRPVFYSQFTLPAITSLVGFMLVKRRSTLPRIQLPLGP